MCGVAAPFFYQHGIAKVAAISTMNNQVQNWYSEKRMKIDRKLVPVTDRYYRLECKTISALETGVT
jgi:hypothetical protein